MTRPFASFAFEIVKTASVDAIAMNWTASASSWPGHDLMDNEKIQIYSDLSVWKRERAYLRPKPNASVWGSLSGVWPLVSRYLSGLNTSGSG